MLAVTESSYEQLDDTLPTALPSVFSGSKVFPSKLRYLNQKQPLLVLLSSVMLFLLLTLVATLIGNTSVEKRGVSTGVLMIGFISCVVSSVVLWYRYIKSKGAYEERVKFGAWFEGIFVFDDGQVVVRYNRPFYKREREFGRGSVLCVHGNDQTKSLRITYEQTSQKKQYVLSTGWLVDLPSDIAAYMNLHCNQMNDAAL